MEGEIDGDVVEEMEGEEPRIRGRREALSYISGCRGHRVQHHWLEA